MIYTPRWSPVLHITTEGIATDACIRANTFILASRAVHVDVRQKDSEKASMWKTRAHKQKAHCIINLFRFFHCTTSVAPTRQKACNLQSIPNKPSAKPAKSLTAKNAQAIEPRQTFSVSWLFYLKTTECTEQTSSPTSWFSFHTTLSFAEQITSTFLSSNIYKDCSNAFQWFQSKFQFLATLWSKVHISIQICKVKLPVQTVYLFHCMQHVPVSIY